MPQQINTPGWEQQLAKTMECNHSPPPPTHITQRIFILNAMKLLRVTLKWTWFTSLVSFLSSSFHEQRPCAMAHIGSGSGVGVTKCCMYHQHPPPLIFVPKTITAQGREQLHYVQVERFALSFFFMQCSFEQYEISSRLRCDTLPHSSGVEEIPLSNSEPQNPNPPTFYTNSI